MASRKGYTSLPADSGAEHSSADSSAEQPSAAADGSTSTSTIDGAEHSSAGARGDAGFGRGATGGSSTEKEAAPGGEKAGEPTGKDAAADLTGAAVL